MKKCSKCLEDKDLGQFVKDKKKPDGLYSSCKSCNKKQTTINNSNKKKHSIDECHALAKDYEGQCLSTEYISNKSKLRWRCKDGHEFKSSLFSVNTMRSWCKICAYKTNGRNKSDSIEMCIAHAESKGGKCLDSVYVHSQSNLRWQCKNGHTWNAQWQPVKLGSWCPSCVGVAKHNIDMCREFALNKGGQCLSDEYVNADLKLQWQCDKGHTWKSTWSTIKADHWCPKCKPERARATNIIRYGVPSPIQHPDIALKVARAQNKTTIKNHWKTNEELVCQGSYEAKTVNYLNNNKIDYLWQPKIFKLSKSTYRPDLYLVQEDKWVEIKGYMRPDAQIKWDEFKKMFPTAELWDRSKLKQLSVL